MKKLQVRVADVEYAALLETAMKSGRTVSEEMRHRVFGKAEKTQEPRRKGQARRKPVESDRIDSERTEAAEGVTWEKSKSELSSSDPQKRPEHQQELVDQIGEALRPRGTYRREDLCLRCQRLNSPACPECRKAFAGKKRT